MNSKTTHQLEDLKDDIEAILYDRKNKFCKWVPCSKQAAKKHVVGYRTVGELGTEHGFFAGVSYDENSNSFVPKELSAAQVEAIKENRECCYHHGCPCPCLEQDCECRLGREYYSLVLVSVD
mgnify:CR=1 FL=1